MRLSRLFLLIPPVLLLCPAGRAQSDVERQVGQILTQAEQGNLAEAWVAADKLANLSTDKNQDEAVARAIVAAVEKVSGAGRIAAARALCELSDGTALGEKVLAALQPLAESADADLRAAAMTLLGREVYTRSALREAAEILEKNTTSELVDPRVRVAAAKSLWARGTAEQRRAASRTLGSFLQSTDRNLKVQGALALAEINDFESAEPTLK